MKVESVARTGTNSKGVDSDNQLPPPTFSRAPEATMESTDAANRIPRSLNGEAKTHEVLEQMSGRQNIPEEEEVCPNGEGEAYPDYSNTVETPLLAKSTDRSIRENPFSNAGSPRLKTCMPLTQQAPGKMILRRTTTPPRGVDRFREGYCYAAIAP